MDAPDILYPLAVSGIAHKDIHRPAMRLPHLLTQLNSLFRGGQINLMGRYAQMPGIRPFAVMILPQLSHQFFDRQLVRRVGEGEIDVVEHEFARTCGADTDRRLSKAATHSLDRTVIYPPDAPVMSASLPFRLLSGAIVYYADRF